MGGESGCPILYEFPRSSPSNSVLHAKVKKSERLSFAYERGSIRGSNGPIN